MRTLDPWVILGTAVRSPRRAVVEPRWHCQSITRPITLAESTPHSITAGRSVSGGDSVGNKDELADHNVTAGTAGTCAGLWRQCARCGSEEEAAYDGRDRKFWPELCGRSRSSAHPASSRAWNEKNVKWIAAAPGGAPPPRLRHDEPAKLLQDTWERLDAPGLPIVALDFKPDADSCALGPTLA